MPREPDVHCATLEGLSRPDVRGGRENPASVHLRSLRIRGFKSFPDTLEISLEPGVAVIVGPNGSGKSNIAEVVVLVLFFYEWRAALISLITIPLSLIAAGLAVQAFGDTINTMVLAGFVIAVGVVVDDAIIDVENITRRIQLWRMQRGGGDADSADDVAASLFEVVRAASLEVRSAVVLASLIVALVFIPVFFLPGLAGAFFRPLATAYVLAILASMVVALTLTPALSLMLLPRAAGRGRSPLALALEERYRRVLPRMAARPSLAIAVLVAALVASGLAVPWLGEEFLPAFRETDFLMHWVGKPGTSVDAMRRITERVSAELRAIPGVRSFGAHIGRAEVADEVVGSNFAELWISIEPTADYETTLRRIRAVVDGYPDSTATCSPI